MPEPVWDARSTSPPLMTSLKAAACTQVMQLSQCNDYRVVEHCAGCDVREGGVTLQRFCIQLVKRAGIKTPPVTRKPSLGSKAQKA